MTRPLVLAWCGCAALNCIAPSVAGMAGLLVFVTAAVISSDHWTPWPPGVIAWPEANAIIDVPGHLDWRERERIHDTVNKIHSIGRPA